MAFALKRDQPAADRTRRLIRKQIGRAIENMVGGNRSPRTHLHEARVDLKKARAALRLVRGAISRRCFKHVNARCRDAARILSEVRDAQVLPQTLAKLAQRFQVQLQSPAVGDLQRQLRASSDQKINSALADTTRLADAIRMLECASYRVGRVRLREKGWNGIRDGLTCAYKSARKAYRRACQTGRPTAYHEWRKRAKHVRYHVELLANARPSDLKKVADRLHKLTDLLGDEHDLDVLKERLRRGAVARSAPDAARMLTPLITQRQAELRERARKLGVGLFAEPPKSYRQRLRACWTTWRRDG